LKSSGESLLDIKLEALRLLNHIDTWAIMMACFQPRTLQVVPEILDAREAKTIRHAFFANYGVIWMLMSAFIYLLYMRAEKSATRQY
jgi:succinate-acetate transporter protein